MPIGTFRGRQHFWIYHIKHLTNVNQGSWTRQSRQEEVDSNLHDATTYILEHLGQMFSQNKEMSCQLVKLSSLPCVVTLWSFRNSP